MQRVLRKTGAKKGDADYGRGEHAVRENLLVENSVYTARIRKTFRSPDYRPPTLPSAAIQLMQLSRRSDVEIKAVVKLLESDQMLAARVLKISQSPLYGNVKLRSLQDAVMRIGLQTLRDVVMEAAMNMRVFNAPAYREAMEQVRKHSTVAAHACRVICRHTAFDSEFAFLCGLLHDVGMAGALLIVGEDRQHRPPLQHIWPTVIDIHEEAAGILTKIWDLPPAIQVVVAAHHRVKVNGNDNPLCAAMILADDLADRTGYGEQDTKSQGVRYIYGETGKGVRIDKARAVLGIDEAKDKKIYGELRLALTELDL